jgi:hypothetical protein
MSGDLGWTKIRFLAPLKCMERTKNRKFWCLWLWKRSGVLVVSADRDQVYRGRGCRSLHPIQRRANNLAAKEYGYLKPYFTLENGQPVLHNDHIRDSGFRRVLNALDHHSRVWNLMGEVAVPLIY